MSSTADKLVDDYLKRLNRELRGLPRARRRELLDEISEHISEGRASLAGESEADIRTLLDRLGDPEDIAAEAAERFGLAPRRAGWKEVAALVLLPIGGVLLPVLGWFIGVVLLWISDAWSTRDKLVGTLLLPGGLLLPLALGVFATGANGCEAPVGGDCPPDTTGAGDFMATALFVVLLLVPIVTTVYLARRVGRTPAVTS
ncbi:MAG: DUF1700 domain-containing protein [Gaiellaceae bacterium]